MYTLTVANIGAADTSGAVTVTDTLPAGLTATAMSGAGRNSTLGTLTCARSDALSPGSSYGAITVTVDVGVSAPASGTNTASVSGGGETNSSNDTASDGTAVTLFPDLTLTKTLVGLFPQGELAATYTLTVANIGAADTGGPVTVTDTLPTGLTARGLSGAGWSCTLATLTCVQNDVLAPGASYPAIGLIVNVAGTAPPSVTNTASVSGGGETNTSNGTASEGTAGAQVPDHKMTKTHVGTFTQGQNGATYTLTVANSGAADTSGTVTVTDTLPAGLTATGLSGAGWSCTLAPLTCAQSDVLAPGSSYAAITLTADVAVSAPPIVTTSATVSGGGETNTSNDTASDVTAGTQGPDLTLTKTHVGTFTQGQAGATYTLTVANTGSADTSGTVTVTDTLPAGLTATAMSGAGWSCTLATLTCTRSDVLAPGASHPAVALIVDVAGTAPPSVTNTASVSGGGETNPSNDTASDVTAVTQVPDLTLTKTHIGTFTQCFEGAGDPLTVPTIPARRSSGLVTVTDTLPAGLTATGIGGAGWSCTLATLTCARSDVLAPGASYPAITLTVNVAGTTAPSFTPTT